MDISEHTNCLYCYSEIRQGDLVTVCPSCRVVIHSDCASAFGDVCPNLGCRSKLTLQPGRTTIVVSGSHADEVEYVARSLLRQTQNVYNATKERGVPMVKILFLAANPINNTKLRLDDEIREIDLALRKADFRDKFELQQQWAVRISDLQEHLLRHKPDIVHFSGHGNTTSEIILENKLGKSQSVPTSALSKLFSILKDNIRCVVLNACYSEKQAAAIAEHINCVVGMSKAIGDQSAISFATAFYQAIGFGRDIKTAFDLGCLQINLEDLDEQDTPKLLAVKINPEDIVIAVPNDELLQNQKQHDTESNDDSPIDIVIKKQETIQVDIVITTTGQRYTVELGIDILVKHAIPKFVELMKLPRRFENNWPVSYYLYNKTQGRKLESNLTFRQNDVEANDTLAFYMAMVAG